MSKRVGIIGSAGRNNDCKYITEKMFQSMTEQAIHICENIFILDRKDIILVSGGSSFSDHVAVALYLDHNFDKLHLHLPCRFKDQFALDTLNEYHRLFSESANLNSLKQINDAIQKGAVVHSAYQGYFPRNRGIARNIDYLIAFSDGKYRPSTSGTAYTWDQCPDNVIKYHCSFTTLY